MWIDKHSLVQPHKGIQPSNKKKKKEQPIDVCSNTSRPQVHYTEWKNGSIYMTFSKDDMVVVENRPGVARAWGRGAFDYEGQLEGGFCVWW